MKKQKTPIGTTVRLLLAASLICLFTAANPTWASDPVVPCTDPALCPELVVDPGCIDCPQQPNLPPSVPPQFVNADGYGKIDTIQIANTTMIPDCDFSGLAAIGSKFEVKEQLPTGQLVDNAIGKISASVGQLHTHEETVSTAGYDFKHAGQQYNSLSASVEADKDHPNVAIKGEDVATNTVYGAVRSNGLESGSEGLSCMNLKLEGLNPEFASKHINTNMFHLADQKDPNEKWQNGMFTIFWDVNAPPAPPAQPSGT